MPVISLSLSGSRAGRPVVPMLVALTVLTARADVVQAVEFHVTFSRAIREQPYTGRVYLFFSPDASEPRTGPDWFHPDPFLACDVADWLPEETYKIGSHRDGVLTYPRDFSGVDVRGFRVQAVARFNTETRLIGTGPGNAFSALGIVPTDSSPLHLTIDQIVSDRPFSDTHWTKLLRIRSALLSDFHARDVYLEAAVTLPGSYHDRPRQRYPTIWIVPGFSGTHQSGRHREPIPEENERGVEFLRVMLDPSCPLGHHVFADSANNGPVGEALVTEFIPELDRQFRSIPEERARFLTGHSSGGWSTLWLQMNYPDVFGGVWSTAPDPVDFRDFQRINLYRAGENMYVDAQGRRRPIARRGDQTLLWYDDFDWMEHVLGPGGQLHSFEAVFSPRGQDGAPRRLWNRQTGAIDTVLAHSWERYDIRLQLERRWDDLAPQLQGKLHVFMGTEDTFLLEGATMLLKDSLEKLGSDAVVEFHSGRDHGNLLTAALRDRIRREMVRQFLEAFPDWPDAVTVPHN